jgi:signal transduction histidine kinase
VCPEISIALFRIFQESLTNIARHSGAKKVKSSLEHENDKLILQIEDDGIGFSPLQQYNQKTLGILGMRERALLLGGDYKIVGNEGKGTFIEVTIPLKSESLVSNN